MLPGPEAGQGATTHIMTAHQRRPGFRLPWSSEEEAAAAADAVSATSPVAEEPAAPASEASADQTEPTASAESAEPTEPAEPNSNTDAAAAPAADQEQEATPAPTAAARPGPEADASPDFMRDLVVAMRAVADEARQAGVTEAKGAVDTQVQRLESDAERRREDLRARAEADIAGIGEWAAAEAERIKGEAEQRVVARRTQLDQQLSGETTRVEAESKSLRDRVAEYERELDAYHAQLAEISDPAAFAAAAKRMPRPPSLEARSPSAATPDSKPTPGAETATAVDTAAPERPADTNGVTPPDAEVHPAEEQVLASRLAELDATLPDEAATAAAPSGEPTTTEIVVSGLGSFGAITGFRQALAGVDGIGGVALSLGQTGEFIFRATHATGFDVAGAIVSLEGDGAKVEPRPDGGLHVTLDRPR
jgi:hypothetical protein